MNQSIDKYWTVAAVKPHGFSARRRSTHVKILATYGDHVWGGPSVEVLGYAETYEDAVKIRRQVRGFCR